MTQIRLRDLTPAEKNHFDRPRDGTDKTCKDCGNPLSEHRMGNGSWCPGPTDEVQRAITLAENTAAKIVSAMQSNVGVKLSAREVRVLSAAMVIVREIVDRQRGVLSS